MSTPRKTRPEPRLFPLFGAIAFALAGYSPASHAENAESNTTLSSEDADRLQLWLTPGYAALSQDGRSLTTVNLGASLVYGLGDRVGLGGHIKQGFSGTTAAFTQLQVGIYYSVFSKVVRDRSQISIDGQSVIGITRHSERGLLIGAGLNQYFFNGSTGAVPFTGPGFTAIYKFPLTLRLDGLVGAQMDLVSNGPRSLTALQFVAGISYWLF